MRGCLCVSNVVRVSLCVIGDCSEWDRQREREHMCDLTIEETDSDEHSSPTELLGGARGHKYVGKRPVLGPSNELFRAAVMWQNSINPTFLLLYQWI